MYSLNFRNGNLLKLRCNKRFKELRYSQSVRGIRDFITKECPIRGIDGQFKEQVRETSAYIPVLSVSTELPICPGFQDIFTLSSNAMESASNCLGQVALVPITSENGLKSAVISRKGSYACAGQILGLQRLPQSILVRVRAQERISVQALNTQDPELLTAAIAPMPDRWFYYVRADAVEKLSKQGPNDNNDFGPEVSTALENGLDAACQVLSCMLQLHHLLQTLASTPSAIPMLKDQDLYLEEWQDLIVWCTEETFAQDILQSGVHDTGDVKSRLDFKSIVRLSYVSFVASQTAGLAGVTDEEVLSLRREAMSLTDVGRRLESAVEFMEKLRSKLSTVLALSSLKS